ncbi:MAG: cytochrome P450, partial [Pirellulaceae bacterium]
ADSGETAMAIDVQAPVTLPGLSSLSGPPGRIRSTIKIMRRPFEAYERWEKKYGKTFLVKALNGNVVVTSNTENIRRILAARHDDIHQFAVGTVAPLIGESSVLLVDGQRHKRARSMLSPPFKGESLRDTAGTMIEVAERVTRDWQPGQRIRVMDTSLDYSLEVIIQVVFGVQSIERVQVFKQAIGDMVGGFHPMFAFTRMFQKRWMPAWNRFLKRKAVFDQLLDEQIAARRKGQSASGDILSMLLDARDDEGQPLSDDELKDQLTTLLFAGHETTQIAIAWAMSWLHRSPDILERLRGELENATPEASLQSELLGGVCHEALRLNPIVPDVIRVFNDGIELEEAALPPNSTVAVLSCRVHADPEIYPNPDRFDPDRWIGCSYKPYEFLAFGGGVRRCIGATMALMEMKVALVTWLNKFQFCLPDDAPEVEPVRRRNVTMAPSSGIELEIV